MAWEQSKDKTAVMLLFLGVGLAAIATFLPVIMVSGSNGQITMSTWEVLPWLSKLKFLTLALLIAAAFLPRLAEWRLVIAVGAVFMVFLPALSAFLTALNAWGSLRADLAQRAGQQTPFVHPGIAHLVLLVAAILVSYAIWRMEAKDHPARHDGPAAAAG